MKNTTAIGDEAEVLACQYLSKLGFKIVIRNYRNRFCEIDIIVQNKQFICFVEVRYRSTKAFGGGIGSVAYHKQRRLINSAEYWLSENQQYSNLQPRIDIIAIDHNKNIEYIENAIF